MGHDASTESADFAADLIGGSSLEQRERIDRYYREAEFDYNFVWGSKRNLARHFGFGLGRGIGGRRHDAALLSANRHLADLAEIGKDTRVLDCGCGLGGTSIWLAREREARITGVDLLEKQIERARREAANAKVSQNVSFVVADYTASPLASESFDVVLAQESLCHVERKERFYKEAYRLLADGGAIVIAEYMRLGRARSELEERTIRDWCEGWIMPDLLTAEEHSAAARTAGFSRVEIFDGTVEVSASLRRLYHRAVGSYPFHQLLRAFGLRTDVQHGNITAARLQFEALKKGFWFYGLLRARK
jgi:tocopherol O-methyltransferase